MKSAYKQLKAIQDLPAGTFDGYYWYSDQSSPIVIEGQALDPAWFSYLPFVVEANFYDSEQQVSVQIRHVDGIYHIAQIDLQSVPKDLLDTKWYIAHQLTRANGNAISQYCMKEAWELEPDPLLANMAVYHPTWAAFAGFSQKPLK